MALTLNTEVKSLVNTLNDMLLNHPLSEDQVDEVLFANEWRLISSNGRYSNVYKSPCEEYALRVAFSSELDEDCHHHHIQHAMADADNPYLPNIYWHKKCITNSCDVSMSLTLMEILRPMKISANMPADYAIIVKAMPRKKPNVNIPQEAFENQKLAKTLYDMKRVMEENGLHSDIKPDNVMMRGDSQLVITDPYM